MTAGSQTDGGKPLAAGHLGGREVLVYGSLETVSVAAADIVARALSGAASGGGGAVLSLAGGSTPRTLYEQLAGRHQNDVPWERISVVFGDDRCVAPTNAASNFRMAADALLSRVPISEELVHRMHGELLPAEAATDYEHELRQLTGTEDGRPAHELDAPLLDVTILGMGADGHTASLFPGSPALEERDRWAVAVSAPPAVPGPTERVTLTLPVLGASRLVLFLVTGSGKRAAVHTVLLGAADAPPLPASMVMGMERTLWLLDREAAGEDVLNALR